MTDPQQQQQSPITYRMFSPDGSEVAEVPQDQVKNAMGQGAKMAVKMKGPDGSFAYVPHDQVVSAIKGGASVTPDDPINQAPKQEGFWHSLGSVFGLTGEQQQAQAQYTKAHPFRSALESTPGVGMLMGAPSAIKNLGSKAMDEDRQSAQALQRGDIKGFLAHQAGSAGYTGAAAISPLTGEAPAKAGEQLGSGNVKGGLGTTAGVTLPFLTSAAIRGTAAALPSKGKAGALFNEASAAAGDSAIDLTKPGNTALQIQDLAQSGGSMPKVVRDFIRRTTDPSKPPLTYDEARQFYSNASRLSADEMNRLTPNQKRMVGQFARDLGDSIGQTAQDAGVGPQYQGAMQQYRKAAKLEDFTDMLKNSAVKVGLGAAGTGAAAYTLKQMLPWLRGQK